MAKARKILARRKAVGSIHTVTRTMEMVATARFKRAHKRTVDARRYIEGCAEVVHEIFARTSPGKLHHPLMRSSRPTAPAVVVIVTSDRGLCGGYNNAILDLARTRMSEIQEDERRVRLFAAGKKGIAQLNFAGYQIEETVTGFDVSGGWYLVSTLADRLMDDFLVGEAGSVEAVYARLVGSGQYEVIRRPLLPLAVETADSEEPEELRDLAGRDYAEASHAAMESQEEPIEYEFVPSAAVLLKRLLPMTFRLELFQCFMEAAVTEQIARMAAMRSASENAEEMIRDLTTEYNRTRQNQITTELSEIIGGRVALE